MDSCSAVEQKWDIEGKLKTAYAVAGKEGGAGRGGRGRGRRITECNKFMLKAVNANNSEHTTTVFSM